MKLRKLAWGWGTLLKKIFTTMRREEHYVQYIDLLEKECQRLGVFASIHGMTTPEKDIAEGKRLRAAIGGHS